MDRIAVLADVHANLEALAAVIGDARAAGCTRFVCLGDVVGYGADPAACVDLVRSLPCDPTVLGNHDAVAAGREEPTWFNPLARDAVLWTRRALSPEQRAWLADRPRTAELDADGFSLLLSHGDPRDVARWGYVWGAWEARRILAGCDARVVLVGHSHRPLAVREGPDGDVRSVRPDRLDLGGADRWLLNPGSVGQPRDGDPRAAYLVLDPAAGTVAYRRVPYDVTAVQAKIRAAGLPRELAERLGEGW